MMSKVIDCLDELTSLCIVEPLLKCYSVRLVQPTTVVLALVCLVPLLILIDYG